MNQAKNFFQTPQYPLHRHYEALRTFYLEEAPAAEVAKKFGYTTNTLYSLTRDFNARLKKGDIHQWLFATRRLGRKPKDEEGKVKALIIELRKKYISVPDIKTILDTQQMDVSEKYIYNILHTEGFARLPRRTQQARNETISTVTISAPKTSLLTEHTDAFNSSQTGILCFLPYIKSFGLDEIITSSDYPGTQTIPTLNSILCFLSLKLSNVRRYSADDVWCMDRGLGLFAGLNVLPKAAWFTSYSHRVTREMNLTFLKKLHALWLKNGFLSDTANLDFTTLPYWGDDSTHLENNWSGTRHRALPSILAAIAHDPDSGIMTYGDTNIRHKSESQVILEFLDFYKSNSKDELRYLIFDSKFTTYENLSKLDDDGVKFITIRRRGKTIVAELDALPKEDWKQVRVPSSSGCTRQIKVHDQMITSPTYGMKKKLRQIAITGNGKIKPALIITNDFDLDKKDIIRKYAKRWLVEKTISEQVHFFHLNRLSSSMVIKIDFDLTMTIFAYNLYRLLAQSLPGYTHCTAESLYKKFILNSGEVKINKERVSVFLKKKRNLPALLTAMEELQTNEIPWLSDRKINFEGAAIS